jgi:hypothetical protein
MIKIMEELIAEEILIPAGTKLFRAADTMEHPYPTPRKAWLGAELGVYFAMHTPQISEGMILEYNRPLILGEWEVIQPFYAKTDGENYNQIQINTQCNETGLGVWFKEELRGKELFIVASEYNLQDILKPVTFYDFQTPRQIFQKYIDSIQAPEWVEDNIVNRPGEEGDIVKYHEYLRNLDYYSRNPDLPP